MKYFLTLIFALSILPVSAEDFDPRCDLPKSLCEVQLKLEAADAELNSVYKAVMKHIEADGLAGTYVEKDELKRSLLESQRAWIKFRDSNCEAFYTLNSGGAQRNEARTECLTEMTEARTAYIRDNYL